MDEAPDIFYTKLEILPDGSAKTEPFPISTIVEWPPEIYQQVNGQWVAKWTRHKDSWVEFADSNRGPIREGESFTINKDKLEQFRNKPGAPDTKKKSRRQEQQGPNTIYTRLEALPDGSVITEPFPVTAVVDWPPVIFRSLEGRLIAEWVKAKGEWGDGYAIPEGNKLTIDKEQLDELPIRTGNPSLDPPATDHAPQIDNGGPAFPTHEMRDEEGMMTVWPKEGMTLRDYLAAQAVPALINRRYPHDEIGYLAYKIADNVLKQRREPKG